MKLSFVPHVMIVWWWFFFLPRVCVCVLCSFVSSEVRLLLGIIHWWQAATIDKQNTEKYAKLFFGFVCRFFIRIFHLVVFDTIFEMCVAHYKIKRCIADLFSLYWHNYILLILTHSHICTPNNAEQRLYIQKLETILAAQAQTLTR